MNKERVSTRAYWMLSDADAFLQSTEDTPEWTTKSRSVCSGLSCACDSCADRTTYSACGVRYRPIPECLTPATPGCQARELEAACPRHRPACRFHCRQCQPGRWCS